MPSYIEEWQQPAPIAGTSTASRTRQENKNGQKSKNSKIISKGMNKTSYRCHVNKPRHKT